MIATILSARTIGKVILYSLIAGVGISTLFALAVSSTAGLVDALRQGRTVAGALWALTAAVCAIVAAAGIVLGILTIAAGKP